MSIQELAKSAFSNTSFNPEARGERFVRDYCAEQAKICEVCKQYGIAPDRLLQKHTRLSEAYLSAESRCASWAIVGPARFPTAKMQKRTEYAHAHLDRLCHFVANVEKIVQRLVRKSESQDDKCARWKKELADRAHSQEKMKEVNRLIRQGKKAEAEALAGCPLKPDYLGRVGYADYELRNNLAAIRRLEKQIKLVDLAREKKADSGFEFAGGRVEFDPTEIRYNIYFNDIPAEELRRTLKHAGFKWSPRRKAWTRGAKTIRVERIKEILQIEKE